MRWDGTSTAIRLDYTILSPRARRRCYAPPAAPLPPPTLRATSPIPQHLSVRCTLAAAAGTASPGDAAAAAPPARSGPKNARKAAPPRGSVNTSLFFPPGVERDAAMAAEMVIPGSNIVLGPYAGDAHVKEAEFVKSSARGGTAPRTTAPSSPSSADPTSASPHSSTHSSAARKLRSPPRSLGRTQTINHFLINKNWYLADLPGFGFAAASQSA